MIGEILNKVKQIRTDYTTARAAYLDAAITSRAPSSTALTDTTWTDSRAGKLDNLDVAVSTIGTSPPITSGLKGVGVSNGELTTVNFTGGGGTWDHIAPVVSTNQTAASTWLTLLTETSSSGVIKFMSVYQILNASDKDIQARLKIDGNIVWTSDTDAWKWAGDNNSGFALVGAAWNVVSTTYSLAFENIPFSDSFLLEWQQTEAGAASITMGTRSRYHLTG
jgi:hypothetical protein